MTVFKRDDELNPRSSTQAASDVAEGRAFAVVFGVAALVIIGLGWLVIHEIRALVQWATTW